jgi:SpoVK/Ycf46/Vps4 family AAA+-type ATPase
MVSKIMNQPLFVILLTGASGTGKTALVKAIAMEDCYDNQHGL